MRRFIALTPCLVLAGLGASAEVGPKDAARVDPRLIGRWTLVRSFHGTKETTEEPPRSEYEFKADGTWIMRRDGKDYVGGPGKFTTDTTTDPARLDTIRDPDSKTHRIVSAGIYKIEGDTLTLTKPGRGDGRPVSFEPSRDGFLTIWKRVKKD